MASAFKDIPIGHNISITVCAAHELEECNKCNISSTLINIEARRMRTMVAAEKQPELRGMLPKGTNLLLKRKLPQLDIVATVSGTLVGDPNGAVDHCMSYVLRPATGPEERLWVLAEDVHSDWIVQGMTVDQIKKILRAEVGGEGDDDDGH